MVAYGGYGMYGGGYGTMSPSGSYQGYTPTRMGAVESSQATPFEKVSGKLYTTEEGNKGSWIGAGTGFGGGAAIGAGVGSKIGGKYGAVVGGVIGGVAGMIGGIFAGKSLSEAEATKHDASDDGKFNGSERSDFQSDRTYNGMF